MTDILIRKCRIDALVSAGSGLQWASDSERHAFARRTQALILSMLDELLEPYLASLQLEEVPRSLTLDLKLASRDLAGAVPLARIALRDRMRTAIEQAVISTTPVRPTAQLSRGPPPADTSTRRPGAGSVIAILMRWNGARQLEYRTALLSTGALAQLLETAIAELTVGRGRAHLSASPSLQQAVGGDEPIGSKASRRRRLRQAIRDFVECVAEGSSSNQDGTAASSLAAAIDRASKAIWQQHESSSATDNSIAGSKGFGTAKEGHGLVDKPPARGSPDAPQPDPANQCTNGSAAEPAALTHPPTLRTGLLENGRYDLDNALPLIALQPLARHGVLEAIGLAEMGGAPAVSTLFAVAIGRRTLVPGPTGWTSEQQLSAALCAGYRETVAETEIASAARSAQTVRALAESAIAATLLAGHKPGLPFPLISDHGKCLIFETEGFYPLCRSVPADLAELFAGRDEIFAIADPDSSLFPVIDGAGLGAIAAGSPVRGESWRPAAVRGWRGMTNLSPERFAAVSSRVRQSQGECWRAHDIWQALTATTAMPAIDDGAHFDFERSAALIAGFALADLSWSMFGRFPGAWLDPDPLLMAQRFGDLSATLIVGSEEVEVLLPLGARFADLRDAGLLEPIESVPWWPGRRIWFRGS